MSNEKLERALALIDAANAEDPHRETWNGESCPKELLYGRRMSAWLERLHPNAGDALHIAARAQHIRRWTIPRESYPRSRVGYLQWRTGLYRFHGEQAAEIMQAVGYDGETVERVKKIVGKRGLMRDPDVQLIEDIACLVFLEHYFMDFSKDYLEDKVISIVQKTWRKMSERGRQTALALDFPPAALALIRKALE